MTSFIAGSGSGRSASVIPALPAAWSHTTIAFIGPLSVSGLTTPEHAVGQRARGRPAPGFLDTSGSGRDVGLAVFSARPDSDERLAPTGCPVSDPSPGGSSPVTACRW